MEQTLARHGRANERFHVEQIGRPSEQGCIRYCYTFTSAWEAMGAFAIVFKEWWVKCDVVIDGRGWRANSIRWYTPKDDQLYLCGRIHHIVSPGQFWAGHTGAKGKGSGKGKEAKGKEAKGAVGPSVASGQIGSVLADSRGPSQTFSFDGSGNPTGPSSSSSGQVAGPSASSSSDTAGPNVSLGQASQEDAAASAQGQDNPGPSAV